MDRGIHYILIVSIYIISVNTLIASINIQNVPLLIHFFERGIFGAGQIGTLSPPPFRVQNNYKQENCINRSIFWPPHPIALRAAIKININIFNLFHIFSWAAKTHTTLIVFGTNINIIQNCQIEENVLKKCLLINNNLPITEQITTN